MILVLIPDLVGTNLVDVNFLKILSLLVQYPGKVDDFIGNIFQQTSIKELQCTMLLCFMK